MSEVSRAIFGDYSYFSKNTFSFVQKRKILAYLKTKYLINVPQESSEDLKFTSYDPAIFSKTNVSTKELVLKGKQ